MIAVFDRKQDFFDLAIEYKSLFLYFLLKDFRDNWCAAPTGVLAQLWINLFAEILATHFELRIAAQILLVDILTQLNSKMDGFPTLRDVSKRLYEIAYIEKGLNKEMAVRLKFRVDWLITILGDAIASKDKTDWQKLIDSNWALSLTGLASSVQSLCITIYFAKILLYRVCNNLRSDKLECLIVLDEASQLFPKTSSKKISLLLDYFQQSRAFGVGVIFGSQTMNLAPEIFGNTATKIMVGGFGHGSDFEEFGSAIGLTRPQRDFTRTIGRPGSAVVKDIRFAYPFTVKINKLVTHNNNITVQEIENISKQSHTTLYGEETVDPIIENSSDDVTNDNPPQLVNNSEASYPLNLNKRLENALRIMRAQTNHKHIFLFRQEASLSSGIKGGATLSNAESESLRAGFIMKHTISKAKTEICLWEITKRGYEFMKCSPKQWKSKGGYVHKFCSYRIAETYEKLGYKPIIEYQHINGKLIDICLKKESEIIFVEVCASYPLIKEISNLTKDLADNYLPNKLIFAVTKRSMKKDLQLLVSSQKELSCPVEIVLAGDLISLQEFV